MLLEEGISREEKRQAEKMAARLRAEHVLGLGLAPRDEHPARALVDREEGSDSSQENRNDRHKREDSPVVSRQEEQRAQHQRDQDLPEG